MKMVNHIYKTACDLELSMDFHRASVNRRNQTIIYIHGGGLIYGSRSDLPKEYLNLFLDNGYDFLSMDYPFYPEVDIPKILECVADGISWFLDHAQSLLGLSSSSYILFGRSSGAYLALHGTARAPIKPAALISLYGYFDLTDESLTGPNAHYCSFPPVNPKLAQKAISPFPLSESAPEKRFMLYLYHRQKGSWLSSDTLSFSELSLAPSCFQDFPRTFLSYSIFDQDVPCNQSRKMGKYIRETEVFEVDEPVHDFDRNPSLKASKELYSRILSWLSL